MGNTRTQLIHAVPWLALLALSCAGTDDGAKGNSLPADTKEYVFAMDPVDVPVGAELYKCQDFPNPFGKDIAILETESVISAGSHHMFAFRIPASTAMLAADGSKGPVFDCPMGGLEFHPYFHLTQVAHDVTSYPPGVGRSLAATDVIRLNMHYLNTTDSAEQSNAEVTVRYTDASAVEQLAAEIFIYGGSLQVPVGQSTQMFSYTLPMDLKLLQVTGHMHQRGTHYEAWAGGDGSADRPIYSAGDWDSATSESFKPGFEMKAGDTLNYACTFQNDTGNMLSAGESALTNEMCNFFGVYYPSASGAAITPVL
jgi:hypothetical protein